MNTLFFRQYGFAALFVLLTTLCAAFLASQQAYGQEYESKFGYVDVQKLFEQAPNSLKKIDKKIETEFGKRKNKLQSEFKSFQTQKQDFDKNGVLWADDKRLTETNNLRELERKIKRDEREYHEDLQLRRNQEINKLEKIIIAAIATVAEREELDIVLHQVVYARDNVNLTADVLKELKKSKK